MSPRELAQHTVDKFNQYSPVGSSVTYEKSEIEGLQITTVEKPAYILGDDVPAVVLEGIGIALIAKVKPFNEHQKETRATISGQFELSPAAKKVLFCVSFVLALAALVTAGSPIGNKIGMLSSWSWVVLLTLVAGPGLTIWRRKPINNQGRTT